MQNPNLEGCLLVHDSLEGAALDAVHSLVALRLLLHRDRVHQLGDVLRQHFVHLDTETKFPINLLTYFNFN